MKLRCISPYQSRSAIYRVGDEFEVDDAQAACLQADSPGSFEPVVKPPAPVQASMDTPPVDRAIHSPRGRK